MAIDGETRARIVRLSRAEGWPVGTIARQPGSAATVEPGGRHPEDLGPLRRGKGTFLCSSWTAIPTSAVSGRLGQGPAPEPVFGDQIRCRFPFNGPIHL